MDVKSKEYIIYKRHDPRMNEAKQLPISPNTGITVPIRFVVGFNNISNYLYNYFLNLYKKKCNRLPY